jgi:reactive intermediate/imine deaminase
VSLRLSNPKAIAKPSGYSHVAEVSEGKLVYISGQVALDVDGNLVGPGDFEAQTVQVFENLKAALASVGTDFSAVVKLGYFVRDISNLAIVRAVRDRYLNTESPPTSTAVEVSGLYREDVLIEVDAVAVVADQGERIE